MVRHVGGPGDGTGGVPGDRSPFLVVTHGDNWAGLRVRNGPPQPTLPRERSVSVSSFRVFQFPEHPIGGTRQLQAGDPDAPVGPVRPTASRVHYPHVRPPRQMVLAPGVVGIGPRFRRQLPPEPISRNGDVRWREPIAGPGVNASCVRSPPVDAAWDWERTVASRNVLVEHELTFDHRSGPPVAPRGRRGGPCVRGGVAAAVRGVLCASTSSTSQNEQTGIGGQRARSWTGKAGRARWWRWNVCLQNRGIPQQSDTM